MAGEGPQWLQNLVNSMYGENFSGGQFRGPQTLASDAYDPGTGYFRYDQADGPSTGALIRTLAANELGIDNLARANAYDEWSAPWLKYTLMGTGELVPLAGLARVGGKLLTGGVKALAPSAIRNLGSRFANFGARTAGMSGPQVLRQAAGVASRPIRSNKALSALAGAEVASYGLDAFGDQPTLPTAAERARRGQKASGERYTAMAADYLRKQAASPSTNVTANPDAVAAARDLINNRDATPGPGAGTPASQAGASVASLNAQFDKAVANLRSQYQLAETDQERARLKFMLEDIEAQRAAGMDAISSLYAEKESNIRERAAKSRAGTTAEVERLGQSLGGVASDLQNRLAAQQTGMAEDLSGLGVGAAQIDPQNEWSQFASAMVPIEQQYAQRMGDIGAEGIDWLADTAGLQGAAQQADLQRAAAFARSGGIANYQREVANRINNERAQMRDAELNLLMQRLSAQQSANELNARLAADRASEYASMYGPQATQQYISDIAGSGEISPDNFTYLFAQQFGRLPTEQELGIYGSVFEGSSKDLSTQRALDALELLLSQREAGSLPGVE